MSRDRIGICRGLRLVGVGMAVAAATATLASSAIAAPTVVTLNFVDNFTSQYDNALPLLNRYGFKASFMFNSCRIQGTPAGPLNCPQGVAPADGYLTWAQANEIYAQGHEIVGHSRYHQTDLSIDERAEDVCADRRNFAAQGYAVTSFAYVGGSQNIDEAIVAGCGYNSARTARGLRSAHASIHPACPECPPAGPLPPQNPFAIPATNALNATVTVAALQQQITDAAATGGGWVHYIFEDVCASGCATTPAMLDELLSWLRNAAPAETEVRTIDQVIGGTLQPPPAGPGPIVRPPAPRPGTQIVSALRDGVAPRIARLALNRKSFAIRRPGMDARTARRRGTVISYTLSEKATVKFQFERRAGTRYVKLRGALTRRASKLANRLDFSGRVASRGLRPGSYRLVVSATDAAGNRSLPRRIGFRVLRG